MRHILFFLLIFVGSASAFSINVHCITNIGNQPVNLMNSALYFKDTLGTKNITDIKRLDKNSFSLLSDYTVKNPKSAIWVTLMIANYSENNRFILNLAEWLDGDTIDVYVFKDDSLVKISKSGYFRKAGELDYTFNNAVSKAGVFIPYSDTVTVFARYRTFSGFGSNPKISIEHEPIVLQNIRKQGITQGIFQGLIWLIAIFSLSFFVFLHERIYLYYFFYIAIFSIYFFGQDGFLFEMILPDHPSLANFIYALASISSPTFFLLFTRKLLLHKKKLSFWVKGHLWLIMVFTLLIFTTFISLCFNNIKIAFLVVNFGILISTFYMVPFVIGLSKSNDYEVRYVQLASLSVLFFSVLGVISLQFNIKFGNLSSYQIMKLGVTIELILFNIAIAYRLYTNEIQKRTAREKLIHQLKINQDIKDRMNADLENLVKLRTQELENQNAEILAQRDDIYQKNRLLEDKNHEIIAQKETIERSHKLLTDSLNYARIIQNAIIPPINSLGEIFNDYFLFSRPKDVVSGDFYWIKHNASKSMVVLADCTGHGVPGAMLSILGVTGLEKIAQDPNNFKPKTTLEILRKDIITSLRQENEKIARDGMDMAICLIDTSTHELIFSSAHQPGLIVRNGEIIKLEASPQPIGRYLKETPFEQVSLELKNNDMIYLYTDGFFDQLGGSYTKKFMSGRFKDTLLDIHQMDCKQQLNFLKLTLNNWMGDNEQTDDITILGIRYRK